MLRTWPVGLVKINKFWRRKRVIRRRHRSKGNSSLQISKFSMYSNTSQQYWEERNKRKSGIWGSKKALVTLGILGCSILVGGIFVGRARSRSKGAREELERKRRRLEVTESHKVQCETNLGPMHNECSMLCNEERKSIPRPTMYQSCLTGCMGSFPVAASVGCRQGSEEDAFQKAAGVSSDHCSTYSGTLPKPEVLSTCRKAFREGTSAGWRSGKRYMEHILDDESLRFAN